MNTGCRLDRPLPRAGVWIACLIWLLAGWGWAESLPTVGSLGAVEYRALLAQSLSMQVEELKGQSASLKQELADREVVLNETLDLLAKSRKEVETLQASLAEWERELEKRDKMLAMFRRGTFEYYEVLPGDTLESIAANPMVYGNASREMWLRQANSLSEKEALDPGTVLIIPRYPEGTSYDL